ncbi:MAG: pentapeptide repeat-containing protein, partial [Desulfobacterales bacterium]|nr:pentapeptide repeat-containing protein [Desulfobacterales bacterium]
MENSSLGLYPELFDAIYAQFLNADAQEAIHAFRALAVTGNMPLYELIGMVRRQYPDLMPNIHIEIARLSRLSFFVIQDIALNKAQYQQENYDINLACVLGMIKKRPERVVKIMQAYDRKSSKGLKVDVSGFMDKTRNLLHMEKKDIESRFESVMAELSRSREKRKPMLTAMFQDPLKKKMETLRKNEPQKNIDFQDMTIENENLSGQRFSASTLFFNGATLKNCDLSASHMERAYFKESVFYNIKWSGAVIRGVNFDGAVFINVDARKTRFRDCSFQGTGFFNCNFNQADLSDAVFVGATISKTAFGNTDLRCASLSHARISGVSFATACLDQAD